MSAAKFAVRIVKAKNDNHIGFIFSGRPAWALETVCANGSQGLRTIDCPATQLPFYIWQLRQELGDDAVITKTEKHGGPFAGNHARYVLADETLRVERCEPPKKKKLGGADA